MFFAGWLDGANQLEIVEQISFEENSLLPISIRR
jgi:hypothetical protein